MRLRFHLSKPNALNFLCFNPLAVEVSHFLLRHNLVTDFEPMIDIAILHADVSLYQLCSVKFGTMMMEQRTIGDYLRSMTSDRFPGDFMRIPSPERIYAEDSEKESIAIREQNIKLEASMDNDGEGRDLDEEELDLAPTMTTLPFFVLDDKYPLVIDPQVLPQRNLAFIRAMMGMGLCFDEECDRYVRRCRGFLRRELEKLKSSCASDQLRLQT